MKKFIFLITLILFSGNYALAGYVLNYDAQQIQNGNYPKLIVWNGSGLTINFTELKDESLKSIWLDDPSKIVVDYAGELCSSPCPGGVRVVHLKRVTGLNFDNLPATTSTTLTVVTVSPEGEKVYKFILGYGSGSPKYLAVNLTPPIKQTPLPPLFTRPLVPAESKTDLVKVEVDAERINLLKKGLEVARQRLKLTPNNTLLFDRFDTFISQLESGHQEEQARQLNSISLKAVELVAKFGKEQNLTEVKNKTTPNQVVTSLSSTEHKQKSATSNQAEAQEKITQEELNPHQQANWIARGLLVAGNKKQINDRTKTYFQVQSAIKALRRGKSLTEAANIAKIKLSILEQLLVWGKPQPAKNLRNTEDKSNATERINTS